MNTPEQNRYLARQLKEATPPKYVLGQAVWTIESNNMEWPRNSCIDVVVFLPIGSWHYRVVGSEIYHSEDFVFATYDDIVRFLQDDDN